MARFLHLADIHLGFDRYDSPQRTLDFFYSLYDVLDRYAVAEQVDFVAIAGDLFEHRTIQPATLNQAQACLQLLKDAAIPAIAIEGNHDNRPYGTKTNWLRYLADWELLILLEPGDVAAGDPFYEPWSAETRRGSYLDLSCGVRVAGSQWYGATAPLAIEQIAEALEALPSGPPHTVLLLHHGLEGQVARYAGALRYDELLPLRRAGVDYLALGHIHKNYSVDGWIFNPGSLEANSIEEARYSRGVYLVEISAAGIQADLKQDYRQRKILRFTLNTKGTESLEEVEQGAIACIQTGIARHIPDPGDLTPDDAPIVELRIEGEVGFDRLDLDTRKLQRQLREASGALIFLLKYEVSPVTYQTAIAEDENRLQIEREVYTDLVMANSTYRKQAETITRGLLELKELQLDGQDEPELYQYIETLLAPDKPPLLRLVAPPPAAE
ncbi:MAG: exonuclease SbcCD subunit D [Synechococcales bacterium]|nr:exonuclease SbcCD subunit D [Synechococcales bacterium]